MPDLHDAAVVVVTNSFRSNTSGNVILKDSKIQQIARRTFSRETMNTVSLMSRWFSLLSTDLVLLEITRDFEVRRHGLGRRRTSSSRHRRLARTCGPMCLLHGL